MKRAGIIAAAVALVAMAFVLIAIRSLQFSGGDVDKAGAAITSTDLATISKNCGVSFPPGVQGVRYLWLGSGIDPALYAKLDVPAASEPQLLATLTALPNKEIHLADISTPAWWKPDAALVDRTFEHQACYVRLVLCREEGRIVLYVKWFSA